MQSSKKFFDQLETPISRQTNKYLKIYHALWFYKYPLNANSSGYLC